jgi:hypothetical protein
MATRINDPENPFHGFEVISTYSDGQAIEDGLLVAINQKDRVSRAVWEYLVSKTPKDHRPPANWPVDLMGWFQAEKISKVDALKMIAELGRDQAQKKFERLIADRKALALSKGIISTHDRQARRVYEENIDGGIYKLFAIESNNQLSELSAVGKPEESAWSSVLWLIPNENDGITLMFPEDY